METRQPAPAEMVAPSCSNSGAISISNSTFYGNSATTAEGTGGAIRLYLGPGPNILTHLTLSNNATDGSYGALDIENTSATLSMSILANSVAGLDCTKRETGTITSTNNLIETESGCLPTTTLDPGLGALQNNGGPTQTMAITNASPAHNFTTSCSLSTDQRGVSRPQPSGGACDLGAFELDLTEPDTAITAQPANPSNSSNPSFSFSGTDTNGSGIASFQCQLDGGSWLACNSGSNVGPLGEASHTFNVRAVDRDGNINSSPASYTWSVDLTRPSVTIDQSGSQTDPATGSPINFAVVFSKPVSGFIGSDVSLSGQAGATTAVVTGGPAMYNVAVSGMTGHGSVIASIASNVATDTAGNLNFASTSTDNAVDYIISIPGAPDLLSPSSGALLKTDQPLLDWNDSVPAAHHYQIQISSAIDFTTLIMGETNILASQFSPSIDLVPGETYYWRVRGINALGDAGSWSNTWSFGIKFSASGALLAPAADEHVLNFTAGF